MESEAVTENCGTFICGMEAGAPPIEQPHVDWRARVGNEVRASVIAQLIKVVPEPMRKSWEVRKLEATSYASARTLEEYNASIKKAFEAGRAQGTKPAAAPMPSAPYAPPPQVQPQPHTDSVQSTITSMPDAMAMPFAPSSVSSAGSAVSTAPAPTVASVPSSAAFPNYPAPGVAKPVASATAGQFNKLPPKPAAHLAPMKPAGVGYQPPPVVLAPPPPAAVPVPAAVGTAGLTQAELLADEKCWQKLEQMRAKFEAPLRTIYETLQKSGREDSNIIPVQKMIEFLNTPREGRPKRTYEDLEKTEQKMKQYFERMYQKKAAAPRAAPRPAPAVEVPLGDIEAMLETAKRIDTVLHDSDTARTLWAKSLTSTFEKIERRPSSAPSPAPSSFPSLSGLVESSDTLRGSRSDAGGALVAKDVTRLPFSAPKRARIATSTV